MPRNLALLSSTYLPDLGGLQFYLQWFLRALDDRFDEFQKIYNFDEFFFFLPETKGCEESLSFKHIQVAKYPESASTLSKLKQIRFLSHLVKKHTIKLIHCHNATWDALLCSGIRLQTGCPYLITAHGHDVAYMKEYNYGIRLRPVWNFLVKWNCRRAAALTTISSSMCDFAKELVPPTKLHLIPNMCEYPSPSYSEEQLEFAKEELIKTYSLSKENLIFLTLSGNRAIKGHQNMLQAFALYSKSNPQARMLIAAHGENTRSLKTLCSNLNIQDKVFFIGFIEGVQKAAAYALSHVYVNTAYLEPFGLTYLEAIEAQSAIIASPHGGGGDLFQDSVSAYLPSPYSIEEIYQAMLACSSKEIRQKLCHNANPLLKKFHVHSILKQFMAVYQRAIHDYA